MGLEILEGDQSAASAREAKGEYLVSSSSSWAALLHGKMNICSHWHWHLLGTTTTECLMLASTDRSCTALSSSLPKKRLLVCFNTKRWKWFLDHQPSKSAVGVGCKDGQIVSVTAKSEVLSRVRSQKRRNLPRSSHVSEPRCVCSRYLHTLIADSVL